MAITRAQPQNMSRRAQGEVRPLRGARPGGRGGGGASGLGTHRPRQPPASSIQVLLTISPLPALSEDDELLCHFGDSPLLPAHVEGDTVACYSPNSIPATPPGQGEPHPRSCGTFLPASSFLSAQHLSGARRWPCPHSCPVPRDTWGGASLRARVPGTGSHGASC